jgi:hypothetical protein
MESVEPSSATLCYRTECLHRSSFEIGGVSVHIAGHYSRDVALAYSLEPFRSKCPASDIELQVEWMENLVRSNGGPTFDSGSLWKLYEEDEGFIFDFIIPGGNDIPYKRLLVDRTFSHARLQMNARCFRSSGYAVSPLEYPLDELLIMHRMTQERAIELHACGIVSAAGAGNLFVGHSEAGKSTTTRLWTDREEVQVLSDDRIIVRRSNPIPHSVKKPTMRMYGTPWHGEAMHSSPDSAPLTRILILQHGHGNVLTRLSPSEAVAELFARSFVPFHRHEYVDSALGFLQEVVDSVPVYRYEFEPDQRAVDKILDFHD